MTLVSIKKPQLFIQEKCSKHFKIGRKDLSRVAKFMSHNGIKILTIMSFRPIDSFDGHTFFSCYQALKHFWGFGLRPKPENGLCLVPTFQIWIMSISDLHFFGYALLQTLHILNFWFASWQNLLCLFPKVLFQTLYYV